MIAIGGVQGRGGSALISVQKIKEINIQITKILHGLHPKIFLLYMLKMLAFEWGLKQIWGISDVNHRSNHRLVRSQKYSSYDMFWIDHSGKKNEQGFYAISTEIRIKPTFEIPQNKRARFRRRYEMLEDIHAQLKKVVETNERDIKINKSHQ